jgi:hypothetical protein
MKPCYQPIINARKYLCDKYKRLIVVSSPALGVAYSEIAFSDLIAAIIVGTIIVIALKLNSRTK